MPATPPHNQTNNDDRKKKKKTPTVEIQKATVRIDFPFVLRSIYFEAHHILQPLNQLAT